MIRIGVSPIGWMNDDLPELGGEIAPERCLAEAKLAGYAGIEKSGRFPEDGRALARVLGRYGLSFVGGWVSGRLLEHGVEAERRRLAKTVADFRSAGASVLVYAETTGTVQNRPEVPLSARPTLGPDGIRALARQVTELAEWTATQGLPLVYHHHMGTVIEREDELVLLVESAGEAVGLLLDTGHLVFAGADPLAIARRFAPRIRHVHLKNVRPAVLERVRAEDSSFLDAVVAGVFTVPGDPAGCVDFEPVLRTVLDAGYRGWLVVEAEQDPAQAEPFTCARLGRAFTEALLLRREIAP